MQATVRNFKDDLLEEQINSRHLEPVFKDLGFDFVMCKDLKMQKKGVDYTLTRNGTTLFADIKVQKNLYNHPQELLVEYKHVYFNDSKPEKKGWGTRDDLVTDIIVDYLVKMDPVEFNGKPIGVASGRPGVYFMYRARELKEWIKQNVPDISLLPKTTEKPGSVVYCPAPTLNQGYYTYNIVIPRKLIEHCFIKGTHGFFDKDGIIF
jgi:hypothetical protein